MKFDNYFEKIFITFLIFISFGETFRLIQKNKSRVTYDVELRRIENENVEINVNWKNGNNNQEKITRFKYLLEKILLNFINRLPETEFNETLSIIGTDKGTKVGYICNKMGVKIDKNIL